MPQVPQDVGGAAPVGEKPLGRDCIVFLPGIGGGALVDQTVEGLAYRLASALDLNAADKTAVFYSKIRTVEDLPACKGDMGTVYRKDERGDSPIMDIYKLDYRDTLIERYENRNLLVKALLLLLALPGSLLRIGRAMLGGRSSKTRAEKLQLLFALGILCMLVVYVFILFGALWATVKPNKVSNELKTVSQDVKSFARSAWQTVSRQKPEEAAPKPAATPAAQNSNAAPASPANEQSSWLRLAQAVVVLWAAIALFLPPKFSLKNEISKASVDYLCLIYYLNLGEQRRTIIGRVEALIDEISRKSETERKKGTGNHYRQIHLFAYSFGSIVALDTLFPAGKEPGRPLHAISTLVTIGCPFDFVRTLWPSYFDTRRQYAKDHELLWLNVYSPIDVLGSNFRNDPLTLPATTNIRSENIASASDVPSPTNIPFKEGLDFSDLSWSSSFTLIGLRAHAIYWGVKREAEVNCMSELVKKLYDRNGVLG